MAPPSSSGEYVPARRSGKPVHLRTVTLPATSTLPTAAAISLVDVAISPAALALAPSALRTDAAPAVVAAAFWPARFGLPEHLPRSERRRLR